jgi:CO dehydrogenase/acetyl-CoA synthase alpha subunit
VPAGKSRLIFPLRADQLITIGVRYVKTLFTIHAGEYLVGNYIEKKYKNVKLWIPSKDTGTDLLVTDSKNKRSVSLQVKFSRDYLATNDPPEFRPLLKATSWWKLSRKNIAESKADYWVFVLMGFQMKSRDFVVIKPAELLKRLDRIHKSKKPIHSYLWVTKNKRCWETRDLNRQEQMEIVKGHRSNLDRDFSEYLNDWRCVEAINGK